MAARPRLIFLLNSAQRHLQQWMAQQTEALAAPGGTTPSPAQSGVLFALAQGDGATMGQLAQALDLAPSAMSGLVQRMEALGWVHRQPCPEDGRTQRVWLRPEGQAVLPFIRQATQRINGQLTAGFTNAELATVARWLTHVQHLDQHTPLEH
ncbi:MarR family winged helix-turn-helix transcriptional regulator [Aquabacterium sp.]|uniref:MarR family winged helix-turn-helix transcriptional regulator n=1 Tax=Aquabacterium sp. TaxID=1872578 RepID=UPI0035B45C79